MSRLATNASANSATSVPATQPITTVQPTQATVDPVKNQQGNSTDNTPALDNVGAEDKGITRDRGIYWSLTVVIFGFLLITSVLGWLVRLDMWQSWIWWILAVVLISPLVIGAIRRRPFLRILLGFVAALVATAVMFLVWLFLIPLGWADEVFAAVAGNETLGASGLLQAWASFGGHIWGLGPVVGFLIWIFVGLLVFALPTVLIVGVVYIVSVEEYFSFFWAIVVAALAALSCVFVIGQSIVVNSGL